MSSRELVIVSRVINIPNQMMLFSVHDVAVYECILRAEMVGCGIAGFGMCPSASPKHQHYIRPDIAQ